MLFWRAFTQASFERLLASVEGVSEENFDDFEPKYLKTPQKLDENALL